MMLGAVANKLIPPDFSERIKNPYTGAVETVKFDHPATDEDIRGALEFMRQEHAASHTSAKDPTLAVSTGATQPGSAQNPVAPNAAAGAGTFAGSKAAASGRVGRKRQAYFGSRDMAAETNYGTRYDPTTGATLGKGNVVDVPADSGPQVGRGVQDNTYYGPVPASKYVSEQELRDSVAGKPRGEQKRLLTTKQMGTDFTLAEAQFLGEHPERYSGQARAAQTVAQTLDPINQQVRAAIGQFTGYEGVGGKVGEFASMMSPLEWVQAAAEGDPLAILAMVGLPVQAVEAARFFKAGWQTTKQGLGAIAELVQKKGVTPEQAESVIADAAHRGPLASLQDVKSKARQLAKGAEQPGETPVGRYLRTDGKAAATTEDLAQAHVDANWRQRTQGEIDDLTQLIDTKAAKAGRKVRLRQIRAALQNSLDTGTPHPEIEADLRKEFTAKMPSPSETPPVSAPANTFSHETGTVQGYVDDMLAGRIPKDAENPKLAAEYEQFRQNNAPAVEEELAKRAEAARAAKPKEELAGQTPPETPKGGEPGAEPAKAQEQGRRETLLSEEPAPKPGEAAAAPETPKTEPETPKMAEEPKAKQKRSPAPAGAEDATGLANQVQAREAENGILNDIEATKGKSADEWQSEGKAHLDEHPNYDYEALARRVSDGEEELTGQKVGILLEGKRRLMIEVNKAAEALSGSPGDRRLTRAYEDAKARLQTYAEHVQSGKGRWSDVGRALQAGTTLDEGNFAAVLAEAERSGKVGTKMQAQLKDLSSQVAERDARIAEKEAELARLRAERAVRGAAKDGGSAPEGKVGRARRFDREAVRKELDALFEEFKNIRSKTAGVTGGPEAGGVMKLTAEDLRTLRSQAVIVGKIAKGYARLGAANLEEVIASVQDAFRSKFSIDLDRQAVIEELARPEHAGATKAELEKRYAKLVAEARRETEAARTTKEAKLVEAHEKAVKKLESDIADLKSQIETGKYKAPERAERKVAEDLATLRAERDVYAGKVRGALQEHGTSLTDKVLREAFGTFRAFKLGFDLGAILRQGKFSLLHPRATVPALKKALRTLFSETNLAKIERASLEKRGPDGKLLEVVRKKAMLQRTDTLTHREEGFMARLIGKVPGIGQFYTGLERFQVAYLNTLRNEIFDQFYTKVKDVTPEELRLRAEFINAATGRSNLKSVGNSLNAVFTSPRYEASRWDMILRQPVKNVGKAVTSAGRNRAAIENVKDLAGTAALVVGALKLGEMAGLTVTWDPDSADFMKVRYGDTVWDPTSGIAPRLRDVLQGLASIFSPSYKGNLGDVLKRTASRTINPGVRTPVEAVSIKAQEMAGVDEPVSPFTGYKMGKGDTGWQEWLPIIVSTFAQTYESEGPTAAAIATLFDFLGESVNQYPQKEEKPPPGSSGRTHRVGRRR